MPRSFSTAGNSAYEGERKLYASAMANVDTSTFGTGNITVSNGATLAGHVTVEDFATVGAFSPVHQFCRIGRYAYIGASTVITQDVPPFSRVVTERQTISYGINAVGLQRKGFSAQRLAALKGAFRLLIRAKLNTSQALEEMKKNLASSEDVQELIQFIEAAQRGIVK